MEIQLHGEYSEEDIRRGLAMMRGRSFQVMGVVILIVVLCAVGSNAFTLLSKEADALAMLTIVLPVLLVPAILGLAMWMTVRKQVRQVREAPLFRGTITGLATDETLEMGSEQSAGWTTWDAFVQYKMSDEMVLLYQNGAAATMVPRGLFSDDESWQQFRQHVRATVPEKAKARKAF